MNIVVTGCTYIQMSQKPSFVGDRYLCRYRAIDVNKYIANRMIFKFSVLKHNQT